MFDFSPINLKQGGGKLKKYNDAICIMQAVTWFSESTNIDRVHRGNELEWNPECASPVLTDMAIRLNDAAPSQEHRDSLWSLLFGLLNSKDTQTESQRQVVLSSVNTVRMHDKQVWCHAREKLIEAIHIGKHGEEDKAYEPRYLKLREILSV